MNSLATSLDAQLSQASSGGADTSQVKAQLDTAKTQLQQAIQTSDTTRVAQIQAQLDSAQTALAQLMVKAGTTTGLLATTA
ncbi:conserved hypothetical protein [Burkholderia sp. 8Y]|uniref:hypothetical protein n=1 Tax=Burkholderia sp. 8Y TaxID=2653133 RepID=UPI0012F41941|nr:hypothetical protein [Burkholderia sp. 8Y]VXC91027.1 conserved hypothetical protein [Burkholderia sp. 8Y]